MRLVPRGDGLTERVGMLLNLAPVPGAMVMYGMPAARTLGVAQRVGILGRLATGPGSPQELASELGLELAPTRLVLDCLTTGHYLRRSGPHFHLSRRARPWLDPRSSRYVGTWIDHTVDYWEWYGGLEGILRSGGSFELHATDAGDPSWRRYIIGQYELARLSAAEVARRLRLRRGARSVLDVAGGHGWFAAELCRRHPGLRATVLDLPGSVAVGREIIRDAGMDGVVTHVDGDMFVADLHGPHDAALCFDIVHHLTPDQMVAVFSRIRDALHPGGTIAVLDMFRGDRPTASAAYLGLFFHLTSGADLYTPRQLGEFLAESGFGPPRRTRIRRIPDQALYEATARA